jgi:mRNA interferase MazF
LVDTGDADVLLARITTQLRTTAYDLQITDWQRAGLRGPSIVRLHKLATVDKSEVLKRIGVIQPANRAQAAAILKQTYGNW